MTPFEHDELLTKCQILKEETVTRPKETNQRSETESRETEHGRELQQGTGSLASPHRCGLLISRSARANAQKPGLFLMERLCSVGAKGLRGRPCV